MAFKRSAVRSRLAPPHESDAIQGLSESGSLDFSFSSRLAVSTRSSPLPGDLVVVEVAEGAAPLCVELLDARAQAASAVGDGDGRAVTAHIGLHPAGVKDADDDAVLLPIGSEATHHAVERRLRR